MVTYNLVHGHMPLQQAVPSATREADMSYPVNRVLSWRLQGRSESIIREHSGQLLAISRENDGKTRCVKRHLVLPRSEVWRDRWRKKRRPRKKVIPRRSMPSNPTFSVWASVLGFMIKGSA